MIEDFGTEVTIDGVVYNGATMEPAAREVLHHVLDVRAKRMQVRRELTQLDVLNEAFTEALRQVTNKAEKK